MNTITAKQLKQKTGEVIKKIKLGGRLTITYRGKPVATITPVTTEEKKDVEELRPYGEAWKDIEETLQKTKPAFKGWREATAWVRNRT
ncbi:MAG: type II toxin-antitoxin system Phd/YefM family antitoxin [Thermodesulfobacteriota bacterium]